MLFDWMEMELTQANTVEVECLKNDDIKAVRPNKA